MESLDLALETFEAAGKGIAPTVDAWSLLEISNSDEMVEQACFKWNL